jgi:hypothetical protein
MIPIPGNQMIPIPGTDPLKGEDLLNGQNKKAKHSGISNPWGKTNRFPNRGG